MIKNMRNEEVEDLAAKNNGIRFWYMICGTLHGVAMLLDSVLNISCFEARVQYQ